MKLTSCAGWLVLGIGAAMLSACRAGDPPAQSLFNGKDLTGWTGNPSLWSVEDGAITGRTTAEKPITANTFLIWTNGSPADFEFQCQFKIVPQTQPGSANSGVQYRSRVLDAATWAVGGYQADIESGTNYTGILYEERMTRGIMAQRGEKVLFDKAGKRSVTGSLGKALEIEAVIRKRDWNEYRIVARGTQLQHFINGKQTIEITDETEGKSAASGVIALQLHVGPPMLIQFKDLKLREWKKD